MAKIKERTKLTAEQKELYHGSSYFRGKNRCRKLRQHTLPLNNEKSQGYDVAVAGKDIIRLYFDTMNQAKMDNADKPEKEQLAEMSVAKTEYLAGVKDLVSQGVEDRFKAQEVNECIIRYLRSESEVLFTPHTKYFEIEEDNGDVTYARVKPDFLRDDGQTIEVGWYRFAKPDVTMSGKKKDACVNQSIELWLGLLYAKTCIPEGESRAVKASYYFMRKDSDRAGKMNDKDFFKGDTKNVVYLYEDAVADKDGLLPVDKAFLPQLAEFNAGQECTGSECEHCPNNFSCNFQKMPDPFEEKNLESKKGKKVYSEVQLQIIEARDGIYRVIAKAGSGKTECVTERGARMWAEGIDPKSTLFITFTDAGATEMKERLIAKAEEKGVKVEKEDIPAMTFHSLGYIFIQDFYKELGYSKKPVIIDADSSRKASLVNQVLEDADFLTAKNHFNALKWGIAVFDVMKANDIDPDDIDADKKVQEILIDQDNDVTRFMDPGELDRLMQCFKEFARICQENCWITYGDIEPKMNKILREYPDYLASLGYEYIVVDEFQDSNDHQMETIRLLMQQPCFKGLMVVGDDCQSIYRFRNTSQENILKFWEKLNITGTDFYLTDNRRSTPEILDFANRYIAEHNEDQVDAQMTAVRDHGFKPVVRGFIKKDEEYKFIVDNAIRCHDKGGYAWEDIAISAATKNELIAIAAKLSDAGIPWVNKYPMPMIDNSRVQAALSLGMAFYQPEAEDLYFKYIVARENGDIFEKYSNDEIMEMIGELKTQWMGMDYQEIPYQRKLFHDRLEAIRGTDEIYAGFLDLLYANEDLQSELEYICNFRKFGERCTMKLCADYAGVVLTTAHSSKGLEWPVVFSTVTGYDSSRYHTGTSRCFEKVAERRRLLYVAMTRARDILYLTGQYVAYGNYAKEGYTYNQFLQELFEVDGRDYDPEGAISAHQKALRLAKAEAEKAKKAGKGGSRSIPLTKEEIADYNKKARNAKQMSVTDLLKASGQN